MPHPQHQWLDCDAGHVRALALKQSWLQKTLFSLGSLSSMHLGHCSLAGAWHLHTCKGRRRARATTGYRHSHVEYTSAVLHAVWGP